MNEKREKFILITFRVKEKYFEKNNVKETILLSIVAGQEQACQSSIQPVRKPTSKLTN